MKNLPLPEYSDPEGALNLASHLPSFFVRPDLGPRLCCAYGVAASQEQDFGTANLHLEVSDVVSVLVYVGVAKGNGVLSKTGILEEEDLDEGVRKRLKDSSETPGALWHIYLNKDVDKVREFLHKVGSEQGADTPPDQDPIREQAWYLSRKQRQRLLDEHGVHGWTIVQFLGDSVLVPAGAMHQVSPPEPHSALDSTGPMGALLPERRGLRPCKQDERFNPKNQCFWSDIDQNKK
uniref:JmjC domain-containing protein n=1 Tax=Oryzias melastigma TaxID=30732 RepID=A0A3B3BNX6_ORYME